jgi:2,4-dienoyl-CoA reductase-like NADH-dependent reductase (Old Yellow Enzyme family)
VRGRLDPRKELTLSEYQYLFTPLKVGSMTLKNRIIFGPHVTNHWPNFVADQDTVAYYEARARGGVGMIIISSSPVDEDADYFFFSQAGLWSDHVIPGLRSIADAVHAHGTKLCIQMVHPGVHQNPDRDPLHRPIVSASQIPVTDKPWYIPKELEVSEILAIEEKFADAAERAKKAGLDGVEIHFAHGYLINQFLTPLKNKRTDDYGGSLENRLRFGIEVLTKVRERVGPDFVVGIRMISSDFFAGGLDVDDYAAVAEAVETSGLVDFINVSTALLRSVPVMIPTHFSGFEPGYQGELTGTIKSHVKKLPVFQVGRINDPVLADRLLAEGKADAVVMIRELISEPEFANKALDGRTDDIRPCAYWNQGCFMRIAGGLRLECSLNAGTGHERMYGEGTLTRAAQNKKVLVVGGGPAGLECARVAALRGHEVVVYEAGERVGGQINQFVKLPHRDEIKNWFDWLDAQARKNGVTVKLGQEVTPETLTSVLAAEQPDEIVVATGARPAADGRSGLTTEPIAGWDQPHVLTYDDILAERTAIGPRVLIVDEQADRIAPGLAEMLAQDGKDVSMITRWAQFSERTLGFTNEISWVYANLDSLSVKLTPNSWVKQIAGSVVTLYNVYSEREWVEEYDNVVLVTMKYSNDTLYRVLKSDGRSTVRRIGDAVAPRWVSDAIREGVRVAYTL